MRSQIAGACRDGHTHVSRHCRSHRAVEVSHDVAEGLTSFKSGANPADVKIYENPMSFGIIEFSNAGDPLVAEPSCTDGTPVLCPWATIEAGRVGP